MGVQALADILHGSTGWLLLQVELKNLPESTQEDERGDRVTHLSARIIYTWLSPLVPKSRKCF